MTNTRKDTPRNEGVSPQFTNQFRIFKLAAQLVEFKFTIKIQENNSQFDFIIYDSGNKKYKIKVFAYMTTGKDYELSTDEEDIYVAFPMDNANPDKNWVIVPHKELVKLFPYEHLDDKLNFRPKVSNKIWNDVINLSILDNPISI